VFLYLFDVNSVILFYFIGSTLICQFLYIDILNYHYFSLTVHRLLTNVRKIDKRL